jgi:hypothetical protein
MQQKSAYLPAHTGKSDPVGGALWMSDVLFALSLLLSTATQLRPNALAIGPGDACMVVWLLGVLSWDAGRLDAALTPALGQLLIFWLVFGFALSVGTLAGYVIGDIHDSSLFLHDAMAYPFVAAVSCFSVMGRGVGARLHRVAWLFCWFGTAVFAVLVAGAWGLLDVSPLDLWYWDRFRGWSANPQQLALLSAALVLLGLHLADTASRVDERIAAIACASVAVYVGRLTKSDSFTVVLVLAAPIFMICKLWAWLHLPRRRLTVRATLPWILVLGLPPLAISAIPLGPAIAVQAEEWARGLSKDTKGNTSQQEAELRIHNWGEAMNRGLESGMLGLGPGPHIDIPPSLVTARKTEVLPKYLAPPEINGTPNFEVHNTPLDLFTQGGLIAVLSFVWLSGAAFVSTWRARLAGLTTLLCGVSLFGVGNLTIRQPIFWFTIALCLVSGSEARTTLPARNWR